VKQFVIDCRGVRSFCDFVAATNAGFMEHVGGKWNGNLDALNDYLAWPVEEKYELKIADSGQCARALGHGAMIAWLQEHLATCHPSAIPDFEARLAAAGRAEGETLFDVICRIIAGSGNALLVLS
jgi:hypothetical protein